MSSRWAVLICFFFASHELLSRFQPAAHSYTLDGPRNNSWFLGRGHAPSFEVSSSNSIQKASGTEPCSQIFYGLEGLIVCLFVASAGLAVHGLLLSLTPIPPHLATWPVVTAVHAGGHTSPGVQESTPRAPTFTCCFTVGSTFCLSFFLRPLLVLPSGTTCASSLRASSPSVF